MAEKPLYKIFPKFHRKHPDEPYKYCLDVLENSRIYLARPSEFNDPFDFTVNYDFATATEKDLRIYADKRGKDAQDKETLINNLKKNPAEATKDLRELMKKTFNKRSGVICLTSAIESLPMWAHYGDNHDGIAIKFNQHKILEKTPNLNLKKVNYADNFPTLKEINEYPSNEFFLHFCRKSKKWEYEQEHRILAFNISDCFTKNTRYLNLPEGAITGVYFGEKIGLNERDELIEKILSFDSPSTKNLKFYRMKVSDTSYAMETEPLQ